MAQAHRESVLAAACVRTPVNPYTKAPLTLYERELGDRPHPSASVSPRGPARTSMEVPADLESRFCKTRRCQDWVFDISDIHHSEKDYYVQVEKLKNAHLHNMEQLEKMYDRKLHLNGVHNPENEKRVAEDVYRSAWEPKSLLPAQHDHLKQSRSVSPSLAESSHESTDEDYGDSEHSVSARNKILHMWNEFTVEDYVRDSEYFSQEIAKNKTSKKSKEWSHKITIPEPFQMTVRESKKREMNIKSKSEIELENNLLKEKLEEEAECQKKFRANPVPSSVYLPLYQEIVERNEERRRFVKEKSKEILLATQKPFQFIEREERKKTLRLDLMQFSTSETSTSHFKAKPVPKSIYGTSIVERLKEEELYRGIRTHMRAQELLQSSSYPTSTLASGAHSGTKKGRCYKLKGKQEHKPKISDTIPHFQTIHENQQKRLLESKSAKHVTLCEPFQLRTSNITSHKEKIEMDIQADEENLKETRWPYKSPRASAQIHSAGTMNLRLETLSQTPRSTESSKRREYAIRKREKQRTKDYMKELEAMEQRVLNKPLLIERVAQRNALLSAEKQYLNVLHELGLCEEFVTKNGQSSSVDEHVGVREEKKIPQGESTEGTLALEDLLDDEEDDKYDCESEEAEEEDAYSTDEDHRIEEI
ncbi:protein FAM161A [Xenopus laevis]|uniref:Protein FAM161A n=1 Tax=Xenopus laevis TaxID=8355 RepID=F161A_XENLA|nr:protein FAM161A [Xenopus laevis]Q66KE9.1 RecName: Full=Protein FAM161A [Xenopus laevis]AAH80431.1 MGC86499 protein [Xenopus laevis]